MGEDKGEDHRTRQTGTIGLFDLRSLERATRKKKRGRVQPGEG